MKTENKSSLSGWVIITGLSVIAVLVFTWDISLKDIFSDNSNNEPAIVESVESSILRTEDEDTPSRAVRVATVQPTATNVGGISNANAIGSQKNPPCEEEWRGTEFGLKNPYCGDGHAIKISRGAYGSKEDAR